MRPAGLLLAAGAALAATAAVAGAPFARADANHDGLVTFAEAHRVLPGLQPVSFEKFDREGDGALDRGEYAALNTFYDVITGR